MIRVSAYCRVSTDNDDQLNSLENQKKYFVDFINKNPEWTFVQLYVDEGISGTSIKKRKGFKQMLEDAHNHKFDLLLTKEISRFARNTLDSIMYTRQLKSLGIGVIFLNDNINTLDNDSELRLTIMASIAQEESRKTSERVKWGLKRAMEAGKALGWHCYGYNIHDGKLTVNEAQAEVVRKIFELYLQGYGVLKISKQLEEWNYPSPSGSHSWAKVEILRMLSNEKYVGTLKQRKEITIDYLTHKKILNDGREDFIIIENNHEAIIQMDTWNAVQDALQKRRRMIEDKSKYSNRYAFSCKIVCGLCGRTFARRSWNGKNEQRNIVWQCQNNTRYGGKKIINGEELGCDCKGIHETILREAFLQSLNEVIKNKKQIVEQIKRAVFEVISSTDDNTDKIKKLEAEIQRLETKKTRVLELFADASITRKQFDDTNKQYVKQQEALETQLQQLQNAENDRNALHERIKKINTVVDKLICLDEFDDTVCSELLEKVVVYSRDKICFFLSVEQNVSLSIPVLVTPHPWGRRDPKARRESGGRRDPKARRESGGRRDPKGQPVRLSARGPRLPVRRRKPSSPPPSG